MSEELKAISRVLAGVDRSAAVLEVGCGYCQKLKFLQTIGFTNVVGVEKNEQIVKRNRTDGLPVLTVDEFEERYAGQAFDLILLSHIIEHFQYEDLKGFLEHYLGFLKDGGRLLIVSPVMNDCFYDDFDHVKSYSHHGILSVFGNNAAQVQFYSPYRLKLLDLRYVRLSYQLKYYRALTLRTPLYRLPRLVNQLLHLLYRISFRLFGRPVSWIGLFEKMAKTPAVQVEN